MQRMIIGVSPLDEYVRYKRLFDALEELFPVTFERRTLEDLSDANAFVLFDGTRETAHRVAALGVDCFVVQAPRGQAICCHVSTVQFAETAALPTCLRGESLSEVENREFVPIACFQGEQVMALKGGEIIWTHRPASHGEGTIDFVSLPPPLLTDKEYLSGFFNRTSFLRLLPLIAFLQRLSEGRGWDTPPLKACLVFDDPNLRWTNYGCLDYQQLVRHARDRNYHAAIATVPIDGWWVNSRASSLFRDLTTPLSLVIHGNDHTRREMARPVSDVQSLATLAQALRRVGKFESRHGLDVCRVLEPPHGVIDPRMFNALVSLGYEAALVTISQFLQYNKDTQFPKEMGLDVAACLPGGLCMIPRITMAPGWRTEVLLAALIGQPLVIACHHYDAADGLRLVEEAATTINRLGIVEWSNLATLARANYRSRREKNTLVVRMGGRRIALSVPEGVRAIRVERPWLKNGAQEPLVLKAGDEEFSKGVFGGVSTVIASPSASRVEILSPVPVVDAATVSPPRTRLWPFLRRALTEARDRAYPFVPSAWTWRSSTIRQRWKEPV